jgi:hypothetical protein
MKKILLANFERTLQMLGRAIDDCPDQLWDASDEAISNWQYSYHWLIGWKYSCENGGSAPPWVALGNTDLPAHRP